MKDKTPLYCCIALKNLISNAGEKTFGVMAVSGERRAFYLEARPFDSSIERKYSARDDAGRYRWPLLTDDDGIEAPYTTSMILPLQYCPACGTNLEMLIESNPTAFDALAARQREVNPEFSIYGM